MPRINKVAKGLSIKKSKRSNRRNPKFEPLSRNRKRALGSIIT